MDKDLYDENVNDENDESFSQDNSFKLDLLLNGVNNKKKKSFLYISYENKKKTKNKK